jgi:endonuclease III
MLSSQTKDEVTFAAIQNLRERLKPSNPVAGEEYLTVQSILATPISIIEECINKVGFWRRKAQYIKSAVDILHKEHDDDIPRTIDGLCALPGVGMKMAMLAMQVAWGDNVGIGVDVHVHRITNRLGWHQKETKTPEETRLNLESWLPKEHHPTINPLLVGFGQTVCLPVRPKCEECLLSRKELTLERDGKSLNIEGPLCPSAFKSSGTSPRKGKSRKIEITDTLLTQEVSDGDAKVKIEVEEEKSVPDIKKE